MTALDTWYGELRRALDQAADQADPVKRAERAARIQRGLAQGAEEAAAIYRNAIEKLKESDMSYGQISSALAIARGTVQGHAEHSRRTGLVPGLIFAFRDEDGDWYPARPEEILPGGRYATGEASRVTASVKTASRSAVTGRAGSPASEPVAHTRTRHPGGSQTTLPATDTISRITADRGAVPGQSTMPSGHSLKTRQGNDGIDLVLSFTAAARQLGGFSGSLAGHPACLVAGRDQEAGPLEIASVPDSYLKVAGSVVADLGHVPGEA